MAWIDILTGSIGGGIIAASLTAWFNHRRERFKLLTDKLEQVYQQLFVSLESCNRISEMYITRQRANTGEMFSSSGLQANGKLGILVELYFPSLSGDAAKIVTKTGLLFLACQNQSPTDDFKRYYNEATDEIQALQNRVLDEVKCLTSRNSSASVKAWWNKKCDGC